MSDISQWSPVDGNNTAAPPDGWPEGMPASSVNDSARAIQGSVRRFAEDGSWFDWGHAATFVSGTVFQVPGDLSAVYQTGRRVRATQTATITGTIASTAVSANTDVTVTWDSGALANEALTVALGPEQPSIVQGAFGTAASQDVGTSVGNVVQLEDVGGSPGLPAVDGSQLTGIGSYLQLSSQSVTNQPSIVFSNAAWFAAPYRALEIILEDLVPVTTGPNLWLQFSSDGGSSWLTSGYITGDYGVNLLPDDGWPGATPNPLFYESNSATSRIGIAGNISSTGVYGYVRVYGAALTPGRRIHVTGEVTWLREAGGGNWSGNNFMGLGPSAVAVNAMRLIMSSGNLTGAAYLYGIQGT